jgi:isopentenyl-diphosphate delta-isomerase
VHPDEAPVVLLDEQRRPVGQLPKSQVHHLDTPLHLAFSCYVFDTAGRLLVTRRAVTKRAWPGVWTNSCCGHPLPGEGLVEAAARRLREELGLGLDRAAVALPEFEYRAVAPDGVVEHEFCPVLVAGVHGEPDPDPAEVLECRWEAWPVVTELARGAPWAISPWAALQVPQLAALDPAPWALLDAPRHELADVPAPQPGQADGHQRRGGQAEHQQRRDGQVLGG